MKNSTAAGPSNGAAPVQAAAPAFAKPLEQAPVYRGNGLNSLVVATAKKVEAEIPPMSFEEMFRGKQEALNQILRILVYESEFTDLVKTGQITQAVFDQIKQSAQETYRRWPKEIYTAMLKYQKDRQK